MMNVTLFGTKRFSSRVGFRVFWFIKRKTFSSLLNMCPKAKISIKNHQQLRTYSLNIKG
jgi:hypothetical protein